MSKELVIGSNRHETKVAILEEDQLVEVYFQRGNEYSLAGSIHKGRVTRVLPGMQSAFVDLGLERDTFLYVSDFFEEHEDIDTVSDEPPVRSEWRGNRPGNERGSGERKQGERVAIDRNQRSRNQVEAGAEPSRDLPFLEPLVDPLIAGSSAAGFSLLEAQELSDEVEADEGLDVLESAGSMTSAEPGETDANRISNQGDVNRGERGGDRGSRRGRRRRPRGRGFPENKYAQPSSSSAIGTPGNDSTLEQLSENTAVGGLSGERQRLERLPGERIGGRSSDRPSFERAYADRSTLDRIPPAERTGPDRLSGERPNNDRARRREEPSFEPVEPTEVIILPGESLAKYRKPVSVVTPTPVMVEPALSPEPAVSSEPTAFGEPAVLASQVDTPPIAAGAEPHVSGPVLPLRPFWEDSDAASVDVASSGNDSLRDDEVPVEDLLAEQEAIEGEAEELALADRIFSHHDTEDVPEDEKLADIEIERIEADRSASTAESKSITPEPLNEPLSAHHQEFALPFDATSSVEVTGPVVIHAEPLATFEANAPLGLIPEGEAEELEEHEDALSETEELTGEARVSDAPQTANLRDPNARSMHRGSRRNRRRRGGNRLGSPVESAGALPVPVLGLAAGSAPALEPVEVVRATIETRPERAERVMPSISDLLKAGQEIIVQIAKEPLGQKGARITSHIALPGRYVVFMPSVTHLGVSRKVASDEERQRLKQILQKHRVGTTGGFIVRTAGEGVPEEEISADMNFLYNLWLDIRQKAEKKPAPALLHYDLDIVQRILRDHVTEEYKAIWVDNEDMYESVLTFMQRFQPALVSRVKMYTREAPIFDAFNITQELEKALRPKVWLKSGGYIVINQTEALVAIDINTGKYVGKSNRLEDTIVKTNTEAVKEIVRQIRLRDLGGIIVVDFIDMDERKNRQKVMTALEEAMGSDKAPYKILQFNDFGLVAITRKRVKQSLERTLCSPCPYCEGAGYVKSVQTTVGEILVEAQKIARAIDSKDVVLRVHPEVAKVLKASNNKFLEEIEEILKRPVLVTGDATLHTEKFDLA